MGRRATRPRTVTTDATRMQPLFPKTTTTATCPAASTSSDALPSGSKLVITQIPIPMSLAQSIFQSAGTTTSSLPTHSTVSPSSNERFLLPKLPPGVQAPSKIIFIQGDSTDNPTVQILNTSRARLGHSEAEIRKRILTGESPFPTKILPKPDNYLMNRPTQLVYNTETGEVTTKMAIPKNPAASGMNKRKSWSHFGGSKEDALDGFDEEYSGLPPNDPEEIQQYHVAHLDIPQAPGRPILPRPPQVQTLFMSSDGSDSRRFHISVQHSPDTFIAPKRKRRRIAVPPVELEAPAELAPDSCLASPTKRRTGRPSHLKKTTQQLLAELKRDCLAVGSDGHNLKCLACNCMLTKQGWGYARQINKHLTQVLSHRSRYDLWKRRNQYVNLQEMNATGDLPETTRNRGRYRKTALDYYNEFKSEWLELSPDGQTLRCTACHMELVVDDRRTASGDISRHLLRDPRHAANAEKAGKEQQNYVPELSDITDSVVEDHEAEQYAEEEHEAEESAHSSEASGNETG